MHWLAFNPLIEYALSGSWFDSYLKVIPRKDLQAWFVYLEIVSNEFWNTSGFKNTCCSSASFVLLIESRKNLLKLFKSLFKISWFVLTSQFFTLIFYITTLVYLISCRRCKIIVIYPEDLFVSIDDDKI